MGSKKDEFDEAKILSFLRRVVDLSSNAIDSEIDSLISGIYQNPRDGSVHDLSNATGIEWLVRDLEQIAEARTLERKKHYINRLVKSITEKRTNGQNDINLNRWKDYSEVITDSLWIFDRRDSSELNNASYWGNFVPQIPRQLMSRYTKSGEWILDPFAGSGTTLFEALANHRNSIGIELNADQTAMVANRLPIKNTAARAHLFTGDSRSVDFRRILMEVGIASVQLVILHPPYYDIIPFSESREDLSNASTEEEFLLGVQRVAAKSREVLDDGRYLALVMGDKYEGGQWIPLGFHCMESILKTGFSLKSIVVKNFDATRGKRSSEELWRYRALTGGYYIFKHEYIFIFQKSKLKVSSTGIRQTSVSRDSQENR